MLVSSTQGIRDEIAIRLNEAESDNTDPYTNWINLGLRDVQNAFPNAPYLWTSADVTLSSGTRIYTNLPSNFMKMNDVVFPTGNIKLAYLSPDEFDLLAPSATAGGNIAVYTLRNLGSVTPEIEFYFVPTGSQTVHYDYQLYQSSVSAAADIPVIPQRYWELLVLYGEKMGLRRRGRMQDSQLVDSEYQNLKNRMIGEMQHMTNERIRIKDYREFQKNTSPVDDPIRRIFNS